MSLQRTTAWACSTKESLRWLLWPPFSTAMDGEIGEPKATDAEVRVIGNFRMVNTQETIGKPTAP